MRRCPHPALLLIAAALCAPAQPPQSLGGPALGGIRLPGFGTPPETRPQQLGELAVLPAGQAELVSLAKIWSQAPHNGFTDLIRFRERWYCAFREGSARVSGDGLIRVLSSADGADWMPAEHFAEEGIDLRDPKLSVTSDNRLMLSVGVVERNAEANQYRTVSWFALDGRDWSIPFRIGDPGMWLWRVTWHQGNAYSLGYSTSGERYLRMYVGPGGNRFQSVTENLHDQDIPTEATLLFGSDDSALALVRRDGGSGTTLLGRSRPPYRGWQWQDLGVRLTAPDMLRLPDRRIVAAGGVDDGRSRTAVFWMDEDAARLREVFALPSGGDNGYPGLAFYDGLLWVSYYSSHEGSPAIYLAKLRLPEPEAESDK